MNIIDTAAARYWEDPTFGPDWFLWDQRLPTLITYPELETVLKYVKKPSPRGNCLEIGTAWGASSLAIALANRERGLGERVVTCDPYPAENWQTVQRALAAVSMSRREDDICYVCGTSEDVADLFPPRSFRLCLIDGDHTIEWVREDIRSALKLVPDGGTILIHDHIDGNDVDRGVREAKASLTPIETTQSLTVFRKSRRA